MIKKMPFTSKSQLRTCYKKASPNWNCKEWLTHTPSVCCLPDKKGGVIKHRCLKKGERVVGKIQTGPRGGRYFLITESDKKGVICQMKVYLPK